MGQQPNIELSEFEKPRTTLEPPPARRWRPDKPGLIVTPEQVPHGAGFGAAGPDAGWALRLLADAELPDQDPRLRRLLEGLATARAAALGRAPVPEDIEAGLVLCGYGYDAPEHIVERRRAWLAALAHEQRAGSTAVADVDPDLLIKKPEQIRWSIGRQGREPAPS